MAKKVLTLGRDKKVSGVCSGLAEFFDTDVTLVRIIAVVIIIGTGILPGLLAYLIAAIIMPPVK